MSETEARFLLIVASGEFVESRKGELPRPPNRTLLYQNYPNPFNASTVFRFDIDKPCEVRLRIYDAAGLLTRVLCDGYRQPGRYEEAWNGRNESGRPVASGIYFYRIETSVGNRQTRKMLLIR